MNQITQACVVDGLIIFRIYGVPQPYPKKDLVPTARGVRPMDRDYRTRKNPNGGKPVKFDFGYKRRWYDHVRREVAGAMVALGLRTFPKDHPITWDSITFRPHDMRQDLEDPTCTPDEDNYDYGLRNCLKVADDHDRQSRVWAARYPAGILFYDDSQIVWGDNGHGKVWVTDLWAPGCLILVQDFKLVRVSAHARIDHLLAAVAGREILNHLREAGR